ncbi:xanthine dehydrogenase family protein molybdopterin-binding subunit [Rhodoplanes roseus]|uniref:Aldehyde oxidase/xanthine dehydrogenase a/b hammerhead domain-containing protein n=1 Tax=Rhodoplanes roseus TaxID=29409 RepID=A0A327KM10_9BRAD|nr:molybdopterin cofactor-binding domain-containing protein [Rhodoplanes roseus]RAI39829.1 hypothetical protein CH341_25045 [Rhodoplanes roseus]
MTIFALGSGAAADSAPDASGLDRRMFMRGAGGLTFAVAIGLPALAAEARRVDLGPWVTLSTDGTITIRGPATEMGQGSRTSLPLIFAEEMDADWSKVRIVRAAPIDAVYGNPGFGGVMYTAGSSAVTGYYKALRQFGAQVRLVLLDNVARRWNVPASELTTEASTVVHAASGRRIGYGEIAAFAEMPAKAPEVRDADLKDPKTFRLIGKDVMRVELPTKVNGTADYAINVAFPGLLHGAVLRTPVPGDGPAAIDDSAAKAVRGFIRTVPLPYGVGVLADSTVAALAAKDALKVTWTRKAKGWGFDSEKGLEEFAAAARDPARPSKPWETAGGGAAALAACASVHEAEYRCDFAYHAQMEPLNAVASVAADGSACELWVGTQSQTMAVTAAATTLGIGPDKVTFHEHLLGGGFGRRGPRDMEFVVDAVLLSQAVKQPVKMVWSREDDIRNGRFHPLTAHHMKAGFDAAGQLVAWHHRKAADVVTEFQDPVRYQKAGQKDFIGMLGAELKTYGIPNRQVDQITMDSGMRTQALRGIGFGPNKWAVEVFIDELAILRGADPLAFRLDLLKGSPRAHAVVDKAGRMADWSRKREGRGLGVAYIDYSGTQIAGVVEVSVDRASGQIKLHDVWIALDCGVTVQPDNIVAQTEGCVVYGIGLALSERITMVDGEVQQSNFYDYLIPRMRDVPAIHVELIATPNHPTGVGQMATPVIAPAISNAVAALTGKRLRHMPMTPDRVLETMKA